MIVKIKMPKLSPDMTEGVLCQYMVEEGDVVEPGQLLFEVETDKVVSQIEAPSAMRVVSLKAEEGDTVAVGETVLETEEIGK